MSKTKNKYKVTDTHQPIVAKALSLLKEGKNKKEIANQCKLELAFIHRLANFHDIKTNKVQPVIDQTKVVPIPGVNQVNLHEEEKLNNTSEEITNNTVEVVEEKKPVTKAKKKYGSYHRLTDKDRYKIYVSVHDLGYNFVAVAKEIGCSDSAVSAAYKKMISDEAELNRIMNINNVPSVSMEELNEIDNSVEEVPQQEIKKMQVKLKTLYVGLIADRHDMPVDNFIFKNNIDTKLIKDYSKQEKHIENFIKENFDEIGNGKYSGKLVVYYTGLCCIGASLDKVTRNMGISLDYMHYNSSDGKYVRQEMWKFDNCTSEDGTFDKIINSPNTTVYDVYGSADKIIESGIGYILSVEKWNDNRTKKLSTDQYIVDELQTANNIFFDKMQEKIKNNDKTISLAIRYIKVQNNSAYIIEEKLAQA